MGIRNSVPVNNIRLDSASTNITSSAYVQLLATTSGHVAGIDIANGGAQDLVLALGAAGAEVDWMYIKASTTYQRFNVAISKDMRVSVKSLGSTLSSGTIVINLWG